MVSTTICSTISCWPRHLFFWALEDWFDHCHNAIWHGILLDDRQYYNVLLYYIRSILVSTTICSTSLADSRLTHHRRCLISHNNALVFLRSPTGTIYVTIEQGYIQPMCTRCYTILQVALSTLRQRWVSIRTHWLVYADARLGVFPDNAKHNTSFLGVIITTIWGLKLPMIEVLLTTTWSTACSRYATKIETSPS